LTIKKKYRCLKNAVEEKMYQFLVVEFGEHNVKRQKRLGKYTFDFLLLEMLLIEYDGYYWHNFFENNDNIKNQVAQEAGYALYRVLEPQSRKTNFSDEINNIKEKINEIQTRTD